MTSVAAIPGSTLLNSVRVIHSDDAGMARVGSAVARPLPGATSRTNVKAVVLAIAIVAGFLAQPNGDPAPLALGEGDRTQSSVVLVSAAKCCVDHFESEGL